MMAAMPPRELLTTADVAGLLGCSQSRVLVLLSERARNKFPEPAAVTPDRPNRPGIRLWRRVDIERWSASYERRPGRPRKSGSEDLMTDWTDTKQQKAILRQRRIARKVRAMYPQGTRITSGKMDGTVYRHVPGTDAQGGHLVVDWDGGVRGRVTPINDRPV